MKTVWYKDRKNEEQKKRTKADFIAARLALIRLKEILEDKMDSERNSRLFDYENPNWALKQADSVGYERALRDIIGIIT